MRAFDVAISGAGLAGSSLALRLARSGVRVALIDPGKFPREKLCGEFLSPEAWGVLGRLGLDGAVEGSGFQAIRRVRITSPRGNALEAEIVGPDGRPGIGLGRSTLDNILLDKARAAGVEIFESSRVSGPIVEGNRVLGVSCRNPADGAIEIHSALTVAADGRHSSLVKKTGSTRGRSFRRPRLMGLKRHLRVGDDHPDAEPAGTVGLHLVPGGYAGSSRIESGRTNLCALVPESLAGRHRGDLDAVAAEMAERNPTLGRLLAASEPSGDWKAVAGVRVEASTPRLSHLFYAGDCIGTVDPLGGQGMTMALLGAELLAPTVLEALGSSSDPNALRVAYESAWHRRFDRRIDLCRAFHHVLINPWLIDVGARWRSAASRLLEAGYRATRDRNADLRTAAWALNGG